ncbi:serine/threonine-protein kinase pakA-like [Sitodiplosis mosellana]|uniref:serine/threonine-protein kinase pakA-like n=1 Tax=Sitodiplosis mosellana TaxID=263140 RepID=UPI0024448441|nr:serine/threonine-protein kinase pakA-like [Sitodiplosis mosellana]
MPLYSELSYYIPNNAVYSSNRTPIHSTSMSPYSPYSRLNPYTPPPPRPAIYSKDGQFKPMLTSISESPIPSSIRSNGLTSLTRINSGKTYNFLRSPGTYVSPRPIHIDTADIDVSASKFHRHRNARIRSTSPEAAKKENGKDGTAAVVDETDNSAFMPRVDQNDPINARATIKRDRNIVRLSTMRQRSQSHSNRNSRDSIKNEKNNKRSTPSTYENSNSFKKSVSQESDEFQAENDTKSPVKRSWRDKFGDSLQTNTTKVVRKTPGELILERHIIRDKNNTLKVPVDPTQSTIVRIPDNVTQQEITYLEPLIRKSIRRQSLITCPSFKDICKEISESEIKVEDDLNAGDLRRRASLILEQEAQILAQITQMRRPSADVTVDETIGEDSAAEEAEQGKADAEKLREKNSSAEKKELAATVEKVEEKPTETPNTVENVIVIKKKTKKKGGKLKHKITVTVEVENPKEPPLSIQTPPASGTKISPTWRAVVEEIEEDVTLNLPTKRTGQKDDDDTAATATATAAKSSKPVNASENDDDFWHLIGRRESIYFKKKVDLKRNEIEIIEILNDKNGDDEQVTKNGAKKSIESRSNASSSSSSSSSLSQQTEKHDAKVDVKTEGKTPTDINKRVAQAISEEEKVVGNKVQLKKNLKNDNLNNKTVDGMATSKGIVTSQVISKQPQPPPLTKSENALGNKETIAKPMEIKPMESHSSGGGSIEKTTSTICPINVVENVTSDSGNGSTRDNGISETACHEHKQTDKSDVKAPTMMQTADLNLETGPQANKTAVETVEAPPPTTTTITTEQVELEKPKPKKKQIISTATATAMSTESASPMKTENDNKSSAKLAATKTPPKTTSADSSNDFNAEKMPTNETKPKLKKVAKKTAAASAGDKASPTKAKLKKKVAKKDANGREIVKVKSASSFESEINATESTDADTSAASESIALTEQIASKLSDRGNDNESKLNSNAGANQSTDNASENPFDFVQARKRGDSGSSDNGVGGLSKFATVANLNAEFEIERQSASSIDLANDRGRNNRSTTFNTRSIADSCISCDETFDLLVDFDSDSVKYSDSETDSDDMAKRRPKKRKEKIDPRKVMKLDPKRKCYIMDEAAKYPMIATPRPLAKRSNYCGGNYAESESESETSSDISSSDECYDECLSPNDIVVKDVIRMSTCSNDSGFEGGGTAPSSPKKMLETSYTYAQFQRSGNITAPATSIPRFKKYSVDDFHFLTVLGKGSFGKVLLAELKNTEYYYAVKCLKKDVVLEDDDVECTLIERKVLALGTKHPYLCHLFCTFQTESHLFFVMEYLNGGDLMFHIQVSGRFPEPRAKFYAAEIISGLKFLHRKGIIYRDLKLDNILLDFDGHVRIADFGMCKLQIYLDRTADSFCGTPDYMAPEIIKGQKYNQHVDWWSFGVLLYEMLIGQSPFSGCDEDELFWSICNEIPWFPFYLSKEALNILSKLLEKDANVRLGAGTSPHGEITENVFFYEIDWKKLEKRQLEPPFKPKIKHPLDTQYFDKTFTRERVRLTPIDKDILQSIDQHQFQGFTYTNPNTTPP